MTLTLELPDKKEAALKARARARGLSPEEYAIQVLDHDLEEESISDSAANSRDSRPIWEVIEEIMKDVPAEDLAVLPEDGASQIDHYVYGLPKRSM